jgi:hypothetical protein
MELKIPSQEQAYWGLRAMKTVALADEVLDDSERHLLASIQRIFGTTHEVEQLPPIYTGGSGPRVSRSSAQTATGTGINRDVPH